MSRSLISQGVFNFFPDEITESHQLHIIWYEVRMLNELLTVVFFIILAKLNIGQVN